MLRKNLYLDWIFPIGQYFIMTDRKGIFCNLGLPLLIASITTYCYIDFGKVVIALNGLANLLPNVISFLIGFNVMLLTLLLTGNSKNIDRLKEIHMGNSPNKTLYRDLLSQFTIMLYAEILLLLIVFFYLFMKGLGYNCASLWWLLFLKIFFILMILFSMFRGMTELYMSFYR